MSTLTLLIGIPFNLLLAIIALGLIPFPANIGFAIASFIYFGFMGLRNIKTAHQGVLTFLGKRVTWFVLTEGYSWILPQPLMNHIEVDVKEKTLPLEITEALASNMIPTTVNITVQYIVANPFQFLSVDKPEEALKELAERSTRRYVSTQVAKDLPGNRDPISKEIEDDMDKISKSYWGIDVKKVLTTNVRLPELLEKALIQKIVEEEEAILEETEIRNLTKLINIMHKGTEKDISRDECKDAIQAERKKIKSIKIKSNAGDFTTGMLGQSAGDWKD